MAYRWPAETDFAWVELEVVDRNCPVCGRMMSVCDPRYRRVHTLEGPWQIVCQLDHCPDPTCPDHARAHSPETEASLAPPQWAIGWDVFAWIGHRRFSRHWAIPPIRAELLDTDGIKLSEWSISRYTHRYQVMLAARPQEPELLRQADEGIDEIILSIDGLQPEKGHETLYVVRELTQKRVWFAAALISASEDEVRRLIATAKARADSWGKAVKLWVSDEQDAFVKGIAGEFPGVPHRSCANHFLRDRAKPILEADSHAKVQMRRKVRGWRTIEKAVLKRRPPPEEDHGARTPVESGAVAKPVESGAVMTQAEAWGGGEEAAADVVLDDCAAVRGILNDDQGGPQHPPGLRMAEALGEVRGSIQRNLDAKNGGSQRSDCGAWGAALTGV
jgi:hypothetical protein